MKLMDLINEGVQPKKRYGCVMLYFDFPEMANLHGQINGDDVYSEDGFGLETEPHTTLLFGLHDEVTTEQVAEILSGFSFGACTVRNPSLFENPLYDVLKFDVEGASLHDANAKLRTYPYTTDYPDYHPHLTVGYLKKGLGKVYTPKFASEPYTLNPTHAIFSKADRTKDRIEIRVG
jgi:hypothetical protein